MTRPRPVSALDVAVDCLAVARIVRLIQEDDVPFGKAREWLLDVVGEWKASELLTCPYCLSMWVGGAVVWARHRWPRAWTYAARVLASSCVASVIAVKVDR